MSKSDEHLGVMGAGSDANNHFYNATTKTWYDKPKKDNLYNQYWCIAKNGDLFTIADNPDMNKLPQKTVF